MVSIAPAKQTYLAMSPIHQTISCDRYQTNKRSSHRITAPFSNSLSNRSSSILNYIQLPHLKQKDTVDIIEELKITIDTLQKL